MSEPPGTERSLNRLFSPEKIVVVGASADPAKLAGRPHRYLEHHGYGGDLYLVNPNRDTIDGRRCYDVISDLPTVPDLAIVLVPARLTPGVIRRCGDHGVPYAAVAASGFAEAGNVDLEMDFQRAATESGVNLLGPNSQGFLNLPVGAFASFSSICKRDDLTAGPIGFVTQSGAFGGALFQLTQDRDIGTSLWVSTGNELDIDTLDVISTLVDDPGTDVIATYIEALSDGRRLLEIGRRAARNETDIVAIRVGTSKRGGEAAASHTGSVASSDDVYDAVFQQSGVTRVYGVDEFIDTVTAFTALPTDARPGPDGGLGVVSISGGAAVLCADAAANVGLPLAEFDPNTVAAVEADIPDYGSATNPMDVTAAAIESPAVFKRCIDRVAGDSNVAMLLVQFGNSGREVVETFQHDIARLRREYSMPVVCVFTGSTPRGETAEGLCDAGVLIFEDPVRAVKTCQGLWRRARAVTRLRGTADSESSSGIRKFPRSNLNAALARLDTYGISFVDTCVIEERAMDVRVDNAVGAAEDFGYPVVVKQNPLVVAHKTDGGGVHADLTSRSAVRAAVESLEDESIVVQRQHEGVEALVGVVDDADFGPVVVVGAGGVFVELFDTFAYRALPVDVDTVRDMVAETPLTRLLSGFRGKSGSVDQFARTVAAISDLYCDHDLDELELNPVMVTAEDVVAVDLLVE